MVSYNNKTALGMVETYGFIAHIEAADQCLKAANVRLVGSQKVKGGYMHIQITGDVGAVKSAIDAAKTAVEKLGMSAVAHVIPRPSEDVEKLIFSDATANKGKLHKDKSDSKAENNLHIENPKAPKKENQKKVTKKSEEIDLNLDMNKLTKMNVAKLRVVARSLKNISLDKNQINFGKKQELIEAILKALNEEGTADENN
ncbi:BMC domain-containing protein [Lutispora sp.]|uniref:BMC domain-containing protein n=1 Tax=Lutispora sp. TaxID=2828727 RepID=UPI003562D0E0